MSTPAGEDLRQKPIGELVGQLGGEISTLVRQEMELAKVTVREEIERASTRLRDDLDDAREEMGAKAKHAGKAGLWPSQGRSRRSSRSARSRPSSCWPSTGPWTTGSPR